jgi:hypothetical protein
MYNISKDVLNSAGIKTRMAEVTECFRVAEVSEEYDALVPWKCTEKKLLAARFLLLAG